MPSSGFRKLTITLTIIVIVTHPSCGFALHRMTTDEAVLESTTDLALQESVQIKSVKSLNDIKQDKDDNTKKPTKNKYRFTSGPNIMEGTTVKTDDDTRQTESTHTSVANITTSINRHHHKNEKWTDEPSLVSEMTPIQYLKTTTHENTLSFNNEAVSTKKPLENVKEYRLNTESTKTSTTKAITQIKAELLQHTTSVTVVSEEEREENITKPSTILDQIAIDSETTENLTAQKEYNANNTIENALEKDDIKIVTETNNSTISTTPEVVSRVTVTKGLTSEINDKPSDSTNGLQSKADFKLQSLNHGSSEISADTSKSASTIVEVKVTSNSYPITTEASRKKYTTIDRKRIGSSKETSGSVQSTDLVKAESMHTTLPISSLEMLREDLLANTNQLSTIIDPQTGSETAGTEIMPTLESIENTQSVSLGTVASKRAGFLDLSKRTSAHYETSTDKTTEYKKMYEVETTDIESHAIKKVNSYESQSQLAEDAIKEELLKEELHNNHKENANWYEDSKVDVKPLSDKPIDSNTNKSVADDSLSVQPINQERRTTLYTVGPNYKPMKRIDVQPAKPFVRDPDDNSWRNESIISLGIVFKPKNSSSKSFKEVLKTKTETEFNNLQDKDISGDTPELRVRLEKIAEDRKSKKKKIGRYGEVVYTDYEEGSSGEGTSVSEPETLPTGTTSSETLNTHSTLSRSKGIDTEVTSPMTTTENQRYWKNQLETISNPKKPYNLVEYYDTTDEYDADYANLPKIDLKKFTVPLKTTFSSLTSPPMPLPTTRLKPPQFPERKPTVQYFPPTTKPHKVNMNDYDVNFEKRVEQYTMKDTPKTSPPFLKVAPLQVATDQPQIRPTVKPSDFTMFTPQAPAILDKHMYESSGRVDEPHSVVINDEHFNRGTYVIKHYRDFLNMAAKDEDDGSSDFVPYSEAPARGVTLDGIARETGKEQTTEDYEYESQFKKDVLNSFVDNFNQNSDRFKMDFPVLFNTSVIHRSNDDEGRVLASSSTFVRRLYSNEPTATRPPQAPNNLLANKGCEPNCENNMTVELSPAYELHYYVPEQEEKEEMEQRAATLPYRHQL